MRKADASYTGRMKVSPLPIAGSPNPVVRTLAEQAFSRAAGAPLIGGNAVDLLIDARAHFDAWLAAIRNARHWILIENYIFRDDEVGREFAAALAERAAAGVRVCVIRDWMGCLGNSGRSLWNSLAAAGGEIRVFNPPRLASVFGWLSRDHRKLLVVDGSVGFLSGVCVSAKWLGDPQHDIAPWRDTGIALRGPAVREMADAFVDNWATLGGELPDLPGMAGEPAPAGNVDLRVVATIPNTAGVYRLDQLIAAMARSTLWLTDAYFVGVAPYVQALAAAARDGVDVRLLVPGSSDIPSIGALSRSGYKPLLKAGVRVFEWNGSMLHAKTAVADGRWARVGSTNLNLASWIGNCELDVAIEDEEFAQRMELQYETDLRNSTEIVLGRRHRVQRGASSRRDRRRPRGGSSGRAAAGALRLANTVGAAIANRRVLEPAESTALLYAGLAFAALAAVAILWPRIIAWPLGVLSFWYAATLLTRFIVLRRRKRRDRQ
jgi:cardiolipin synthase